MTKENPSIFYPLTTTNEMYTLSVQGLILTLVILSVSHFLSVHVIFNNNSKTCQVVPLNCPQIWTSVLGNVWYPAMDVCIVHIVPSVPRIGADALQPQSR